MTKNKQQLTLILFILISIYHLCRYLISKNQMKRILCSMILLLGISFPLAQNISVSPYSSFGYGDYKSDATASIMGMGGSGTAFLSIFGSESNFMNPAANQNLRYTNFVFEGATDIANINSKEESATRSSSYVSRISLGFPLGNKFRAGVGFKPFSAVGYRSGLYDLKSDPKTINKFSGEGGLNALQAMVSYNIAGGFAIGAKTEYVFGNINKLETFSSENNQLATDYSNKNKINGFNFSGGLSYTKLLENKKRITLGGTYGLGSKLTAKQEYMVTTYQVNASAQHYNIDTVRHNNRDRKLNLPQTASIGVSYGEDFKWSLGAQFDWEGSSGFSIADDNKLVNDRMRASVGGYYIPQFNSFRSYFARVIYRAGLFYENTPISIKEEDIKNYGITFGFGLPVGKATDPSTLDFGVELGRRGSLEKGLLQENYANLKLSFTLNDSWFQQRKYD